VHVDESPPDPAPADRHGQDDTAAPGVPMATVARLCGLTLHGSGRGFLERRVDGLALFDPESHGDLTGVVLCAPGHDLSVAGNAVVARAIDGAAAALLVTPRQCQDAQAQLPSGIPLLVCPGDTAWAELVGQVRAVLAAGDPDQATRTLDLPQRDLVFLANTTADRVGGSVTIFSPQQEVLASSRVRPDDDPLRRQAVLDQHGPRWYREHLRARGVYARLWADDQVVDVPPLPERDVRRRLAVAVRAGDEILGSLWAAEGGSPLAPDAAATLQHAAHAAAVRLLELHEQGQAARRADEDAARAVMSGQGSLDAACTQLGADPELPCAVVAVEPTRGTSFSARRLSEALALHSSAYRWTAAAVARGERRVDLLVCNLVEQDPVSVRRMMGSFARDCEHTAIGSLRAGVGPALSLDRAPESASTADLVLRALRHDGRAGVATGEDVWACVGLLQLRSRLHDLVLPAVPLDDLDDLDAGHGTDLVATVKAYLECLGDVSRAGRSLNVHANTVRYRLRRIRDLVGLDLDDPDQRLFVWLQLRTRALRAPSAAGDRSNRAP
jgi:hypothetical protein